MKKNTIEEIVVLRNTPQIPFKRASTSNADRKIPKPNKLNIKLINLNTSINNTKKAE